MAEQDLLQQLAKPQPESANTRMYVSDPRFKSYDWYVPKSGVWDVVNDYFDKVVSKGRNVPINLWMGKAFEESSFRQDEKRGSYYQPLTLFTDRGYNKPYREEYSKLFPERKGKSWENVKHYVDWLSNRIPSIDADYAAYKLDEGMRKGKGDVGKAAWWYNTGKGKVGEELAPTLGKSVLQNPYFQDVWTQRLRGLYKPTKIEDE